MQDIRRLYDGEIMSVDGHVRDLFSELESRGFLENAIVVIISDHGEGLWEHGWVQHGETLYDALIHVPLMIQVPGADERRDVDELAALIDVAPTLLDLVGISIPSAFEGRSLTHAWQEDRSDWLGSLRRALGLDAREVPPVLSQLIKAKGERLRRSFHERTVVFGEQKLIISVNGQREFYDLEHDPGERNPVALDEPGRELLMHSLEGLQKRASRAISPEKIKALDEAEKERLRALGYLQ